MSNITTVPWTRSTATLLLTAVLLAGCAANPGQSHDAPATDASNRTIFSDDGVSQLTVPGNWQPRPDFGPDAGIRVAAADGSAFLVVNSYFPDELEPASIAEFSHTYAMSLKESLGDAELSDGHTFELHGAPAHRHVVTGNVDDVRLTYVSTVVQGVRAMHHLIGWVAADYDADRKELEQVIATFIESPDIRPARERIALSFAWPESLQSTVDFRQTKVKRGKETELKAIYLSSVQAGANDELVISTRVMNQNLAGASGARDDFMSTLLEQVTSGLPDFVVNRGGEFVRVENLAAYRERVEQAVIANLPESASGAKDKVLAVIKPGLTEEFLSAAVADEWNKTVGSWANSSYVPGQTYTFDEAYYAPALGATPFGMKVSRRVAGPAACAEESASTCVRLLVTATISGEDFRSAMTRFLSNTLERPVNIRDISVVRTIEIITEPSTLIPHRTHTFEETTVVIEDDDGQTHTSRESEDTNISYSYKSYRAGL